MALQPCGTLAAYKRHARADEPPCEACKRALAERDRGRYAAKNPDSVPHGTRRPHRHGTNAGYTRHYTDGTKPCDECRQAHRAYLADRDAQSANRCSVPHCPRAHSAKGYCKRHYTRLNNVDRVLNVVLIDTFRHLATLGVLSCAYCNLRLVPEEVVIDHVQPLALGGADELANLTPACRACNASKGAKTFEAWSLWCATTGRAVPREPALIF